ncbi:uncharacterized protein At4g15970-like [Lotus japonicus]|uniref:uncharacterized protein At4g15970-like n=1 Tax=Lotus japonicus TaxID=34305 RepID=UPI0025879449|nr:uncharacterized protein At4g15970-like [Lotus japonicus]
MKDSVAAGEYNSSANGTHHYVRRVMLMIIVFLIGYAVLVMFLYNSSSPHEFPTNISRYRYENYTVKKETKLEKVLRKASMEQKTVIVTSLNDAWAQPGSIFDLFLESFHVGGNQTLKFLKHLVVITWDQNSHTRCKSVHKHCYQIETNNITSEAFFMTPHYLHMVWRKIEFLGEILQMGYNFIFTDSDIMWLRDPFRYFYKDADFQISCDSFNGNSSDMENLPNSGFSYVKSNERTIWFYNFWYNSSEEGLKTQDVLNKIKLDPLVSEKKLTIRFLSTRFFGGFCEPSKDFRKVSTMHANCCIGLQNKVNDLRLLLEDWRKYMALPKHEKKIAHPSWSALTIHTTDAMKESRISGILASLSTLQHRRMDFDEFCAAALSVHQLEVLAAHWEQRCAMVV